MKRIWMLVSLLMLSPMGLADSATISWRSDVPQFSHTPEDMQRNWNNWHREDHMEIPTAEQYAARVKASEALQKEFPEGTDFAKVTQTVLDSALLLHNGKLREAYELAADAKHFGVIVRAHARYLNTYYSVTDKNVRIAEFKAVADEIETALAKEPKDKDLLFIHAYMHGRYLEELPFKMGLVPTYTNLFNGVKDLLKDNPRHLGAQLILASFHADGSVKAPFLAKVRFGSNPEIAIEKFEAALKQDPGSTIAQLEYAMARIKLNKGKPDDAAIAALNAAVATSPSDANATLAQLKAKALLADSAANASARHTPHEIQLAMSAM
jgi:tetratricopeptide (TPR) repeat protein